MATRKAKTKEVSYLYTDESVAQMAREYLESTNIGESISERYLKVLVAHSQVQLKDLPNGSPDNAKAAIAAAHSRLYGVILAGVGLDVAASNSPDEAKERNRRTAYARKAKLLLTNWVKVGYALASLRPAAVTGAELQKQYVAKRPEATFEQQIESARKRVVALLKELAEQDQASARDQAEKVQREILGALPPTKQLTGRRKRVGEIVLHPH